MEHNGSDLLAVATYSPWQHLKAAVKCQSVAMLRRVMRAPDPGVRLGHGLPGGEGTHPASPPRRPTEETQERSRDMVALLSRAVPKPICPASRKFYLLEDFLPKVR